MTQRPAFLGRAFLMAFCLLFMPLGCEKAAHENDGTGTGDSGKADELGGCQPETGLYEEEDGIGVVLNYDCEHVQQVFFKFGENGELTMDGVDLYAYEGGFISTSLFAEVYEGEVYSYLVLQTGSPAPQRGSQERGLIVQTDENNQIIPESAMFLYFDDMTPTRAGIYYALDLEKGELGMGEAHVVSRDVDSEGETMKIDLRIAYQAVWQYERVEEQH